MTFTELIEFNELWQIQSSMITRNIQCLVIDTLPNKAAKIHFVTTIRYLFSVVLGIRYPSRDSQVLFMCDVLKLMEMYLLPVRYTLGTIPFVKFVID